MISEELVFPWLDLKRCRQSLYHLPYNHHQLFDNGTLSNLGAENSHRRNISRAAAAMLLPIFLFFLTMGYHHLQNSYNSIQKLQKNLHTYATTYILIYLGNMNVTFLNTYFFMI